MREIKFRAWHRKSLKMYLVNMIDFFFKKMALWFDNEAPLLIDRKSESRVCALGDVELMQYTGLKDKNGKEIYEGDILKEFPIEGNEHFNIVPAEWVCDDYYNGWSCEPDDAKNSEVIGNIYENPELQK